MCTDDTPKMPPGSPDNVAPPPDDSLSDRAMRTNMDRRKLLKAAALGTAAAAFMHRGGDGLRIGPLSASANDLSTNPCTAGDVSIIGEGIVLNEPCDCTGTFDAEVQFTVRNITSTPRYCIAIHFPGTGEDVILYRVSDGKSEADGKDQGSSFKDTIMVGTIADYPCGAGEVCFGQPGVTRGKCAAGTCTTIAWNTSPNAANCTTADQSPPGGQCRHQQICIVGRGHATLDCDTDTVGTQTDCTVPCGSTTTVRLCTTDPATFGPWTFQLDGQSFGPTTDTCHDFTVGPIAGDTTITGTVTSDDGCETSASVTLHTGAVEAPVLEAGDPDCDGNVTFTVTNCHSDLTYTYEDCTTGDLIDSGLGLCSVTVTFPPGANDATYCVRVTASNGFAACDESDEASVTVPAQVAVSLDVSGEEACNNGVLTFTATASGGVGPYTYTFKEDGNIVQGPNASNSWVRGIKLDGNGLDTACHTVSVEVQDDRGCPGTPASDFITLSQCVTTTLGCDAAA